MPFTHQDRQNISNAEEQARLALNSFKKLTRKGKDLERMKLLETIVQAFELLRLVG